MLERSTESSPIVATRERWIGRLLWAALAAVVIGGSAIAAVLAFGAADPPRAGPLYTEFTSSGPQKITVGGKIRLPPPPYTLEITAELPPNSDGLAWWGVNFGGGKLAISLSADAYFTMPPVIPDWQSFFHIQPPGKTNRLYLNVHSSGRATLRFNGEIAWEGTLSMLFETPDFLIASSSPHQESLLIVHRIAIFAPQN